MRTHAIWVDRSLLTGWMVLLLAGWNWGCGAAKQGGLPVGNGRRVILNDDSTGQTTRFKPPVKASDLNAMVDKVAGTGVTTLSVALYDSHVVWHDSQVATWLGDLEGPIMMGSQYRIISTCRSLRKQGIDPLRVYVERAHEQGLEFFVASRMNDGHFAYYRGPNGSGPRASGYASKFWKEHPELLLQGEKGYWQHLYDYSKEATRHYRLAQIEEICRNYDIDGFEMDFMRTPHYFKEAEARQNAHFMTELVSNVRKMMDEAGRVKGKRLVLMVTVPRTIGECEQIGLDVRTWVKQGLIDLLVAKNFIYFEQHLPVKEWAALVKGSQVKFYAGFEHGDTIETFRAGAAKYFRDGADGIYFYNFWSFGLPYNALGRQILSEVGDPRQLEGQDKHYALLGGGPCRVTAQADPRPPLTQVPAQVAAGGSRSFTLDLADEIPAALKAGTLKDVTLRVATEGRAGRLEFALNDQPMEASLWKVREKEWEAVLTQPGLNSGVNKVTVANKGAGSATISSLETLVHYHGSRPAASLPAVLAGKLTSRDTRYAAEEGPWKRLQAECPSVPLKLSARKWVKARVKIASAKALASAKTVRLEFRTPQTNTRDYRWWKLYGGQPWETDQYEFRVNGRSLEKWEFIRAGRNPADYWMWGVRFDVPAEWLRAGDNSVELQLKEREPQIGWGLTFVHVDLFQQ